MTYTQDHRSDVNQQRTHQFINVSGETVPPRAALKVVAKREGSNGGTILDCDKPDGTGNVFAVNGRFAVSATTDKNYGECSLHWPALVLASSTGEIGPVAGSFTMTSAGKGFHVIGALTDGKALVMGSVGTSSGIWFTATIASDYAPSDTGNVSITPGSAIGTSLDVSSFTSAENPYGCSGCAGDAALCVLDPRDSNRVRLVTVKHKEVKPLLSVVVNATTKKLQGIRQPISVMFCGSTETFDIDDLNDNCA